MSKMTITGTRIKREDVEIEVRPEEIVNLVRRKLGKKYPVLAQDTYIQDGNVYAYTYTNGHTGADEYEKLRKATKEDIRIMDVFETIKSAFEE